MVPVKSKNKKMLVNMYPLRKLDTILSIRSVFSKICTVGKYKIRLKSIHLFSIDLLKVILHNYNTDHHNRSFCVLFAGNKLLFIWRFKLFIFRLKSRCANIIYQDSVYSFLYTAFVLSWRLVPSHKKWNLSNWEFCMLKRFH